MSSTTHTIDPNFKQGGTIGPIEQLDLTTSNPQTVAIVDGTGDQITSFGGGTQYTEGDADTTITGTALMWEDTADTLRAVSSAKPLPVSVTGGGDATAANQTTMIGHLDGVEGLLTTIDADTGSIDAKTPALGQALAAASVPVVLTAAQITTLTPPAAITGFATSAKQDTLDTSINTLLKPASTLTAVTTVGTVTTLTGGAIASGSADSGNPVKIGGRYNSTQPTFTDGQRADLQIGSRGSLRVEVFGAGSTTSATVASPADNTASANGIRTVSQMTVYDGANWDMARGDSTDGLLVNLGTNNDVSLNAGTNNIGDVDILSIAAGDNNIGNVDIVSGTITTVSTLTGGGVAHDSADSGNPHKIGLKAYSPDGTTPGTAVAEGDRTDAKGDLDGRLFVNDEHPRWGSYHVDGSSALTDATVAASPGAGFQTVITNICVSSGAATAMNMFLEEGSTKIFGPIYLEAVAGRGFCTPAGFKKHVTAATAVTITTSAAIAHSVDIQYITQAV